MSKNLARGTSNMLKPSLQGAQPHSVRTPATTMHALAVYHSKTPQNLKGSSIEILGLHAAAMSRFDHLNSGSGAGKLSVFKYLTRGP